MEVKIDLLEQEAREEKSKCPKRHKLRSSITGKTLTGRWIRIHPVSCVIEAKIALTLCWKSEEQLKIAQKRDTDGNSQV